MNMLLKNYQPLGKN